MRPNAFTVGEPNSYEAALRQPRPLYKTGRHEKEGQAYEGGIVFPTYDAATEWLTKHPERPYKVFGLVLPKGWSQDVRDILPGEDHHRLLNDARIVHLEKP
jgi:hypothetical protein